MPHDDNHRGRAGRSRTTGERLPTDATQQAPATTGAPVSLTGDPLVDAILQGGGLPGTAGNDPVGGIFNPQGPLDPVTGKLLGPLAQTAEHGIGAPYTAEFVDALWAGMPLEDRIRLQDELVALGMTGSVIPGEFDDGTVAGIKQLLSLSNRAGTTWEATIGRLRDLESQGLLGREQATFEPDPYVAPDYALWSQLVKEQFAQDLGREPDQGELAQFTAELQGWDKLAFERDQELRELQFEHANTPGVQGGGVVQGVDPVARFQERFNQLYRGELEFLEDKQAAQTSRQTIESATGTLGAISGEGERR